MWTNRFWSHLVHHDRLTERLHYYFLRIRPFNPNQLKKGIELLIKEQGLGGIRCYSVFGRYDLVVRAWLHPSLAANFYKWLEGLEGCRRIRQFVVEDIVHAWYHQEKTGSQESLEIIKELDQSKIIRVQRGQEDSLAARLMSHGLAMKTPKSIEAIKFFVTIRLQNYQLDDKIQHAQTATRFAESTGELTNIATYCGLGEECTLLLKAQARDFFSISKIPIWVNESIPGARTETYISLDKMHLLADDRIGMSTFNEIQGRDLMVQGLIPEVYEPKYQRKSFSERSENIVAFIKSDLSEKSLTRAQRDFLRSYITSYLNDDDSRMIQFLFKLFIDIERYLRENIESFVGRKCQGKSKKAFEAAEGDDRKRLSIGDMLKVYSKAVEISGENQEVNLKSGWQDFVNLRNSVAHGDLEFDSTNWSNPLKVILLRTWPTKQLLSLVARTTDVEFSGEYFGQRDI